MLYPKDRNIHRPLHLYFENEMYFITARTVDAIKLFNTPAKLQILKNRLKQAKAKYQFNLYAWVINANHYHILISTINQYDLAKICNFINGGSSHDLNQHDQKKGRKIWKQYWDKSARTKKAFWRFFNYIHLNPIKHGYIKNLKELKEYPFCSYRDYVKKFGEAWLMECLKAYPVIKNLKIE